MLCYGRVKKWVILYFWINYGILARYMHKIVVWNPEIEKYEAETEMKYWRSGSNGQSFSVVNVNENFVKLWCH